MGKVRPLIPCPECGSIDVHNGNLVHNAGCTYEAPYIAEEEHDKEEHAAGLTVDYRVAQIMKFFEYQHLPPRLNEVSKKFFTLAAFVLIDLPDNEEKLWALRKLLEAKDSAVRSCL